MGLRLYLRLVFIFDFSVIILVKILMIYESTPFWDGCQYLFILKLGFAFEFIVFMLAE
jgi:hypothetical protein